MQGLRFSNPTNGHVTEISRMAPLWTCLFGAIYMAYKGLWGHVFILVGITLFSFLLPYRYGIATVLLVNLAYASWVIDLLANHYGKKGLVNMGSHRPTPSTTPLTLKPRPQTATQPMDDSVSTITNELSKLAKLKDTNIITENEFLALKSKLLNT